MSRQQLVLDGVVKERSLSREKILKELESLGINTCSFDHHSKSELIEILANKTYLRIKKIEEVEEDLADLAEMFAKFKID